MLVSAHIRDNHSHRTIIYLLTIRFITGLRSKNTFNGTLFATPANRLRREVRRRCYNELDFRQYV